MRGRYFLDTNVLVYSFDSTAPQKRRRARALIAEALRRRSGIVSSQVVQEFLNVATRKFEAPMTAAQCHDYFDSVLAPLCEVLVSLQLQRDAIRIRDETGFSYYDALIVAGALAGGCQTLYSEDLQHGREVGPLTIRNPFRPPETRGRRPREVARP